MCGQVLGCCLLLFVAGLGRVGESPHVVGIPDVGAAELEVSLVSSRP